MVLKELLKVTNQEEQLLIQEIDDGKVIFEVLGNLKDIKLKLPSKSLNKAVVLQRIVLIKKKHYLNIWIYDM